MLLLFIFLLIFISVSLIVAGIILPFEKRIRLLNETSTKEKPKFNLYSSRTFQALKKASDFINKPFSKLVYIGRLQSQLDFLKSPLGAIELLMIKEVLLILAGFLASVILPRYTIIVAIAAFFAPDFILNSKVRAKKEAIIKYFPETVDLMDLCIGAGLDFVSALRWITEKSLPNPFIEQLELVMNEIQVGKARSEALKTMANNLKLADISSFSRTIIQAERMGTSVEEALRNLSEDTRASRFERGERYAIKASLKILIPLLFFILPVIMIIVAGPVIIKFTQGGLFPGQ